MSGHAMKVLSMLALQHLWQAALLLVLVWVLGRSFRTLGADVRSWVLLCAFMLAVILPLAVLLPGHRAAPGEPASYSSIVVSHNRTLPASAERTADRQTPTIEGWPAMVGSLLIGVWLVGFLWSLQRLLAGYLAARRLHQAAKYLPDATSAFSHALPHGVVIRMSDQISSPMVVGLARPCILFPQRLIGELPAATRLHVLHHELAHIRRRDLWAALIQALCLAVYWWSPLLRLLGAKLDAAREMACDERAAMQSRSSTDYANALLASASKLLAGQHAPRPLAAGIFTNQATLSLRIEELLNLDIKDRVSGTRPIATACATVILASVSLTLLATPRLGRTTPTNSVIASAPHDANGAKLVEAVESNQPQLIRLLIKNGADINATVSGDGTALLVAAKRGNLTIVRELIRLGANVNQPSHGDGNPLIAAAAYGNLEVAQVLMDAGADVNAIVPGDETPLINAARRGHLSIVQSLVEHGANVNLGTKANSIEWRSPLNQATDVTIRQYLIDKGAVQDN